MKSGKRQGVVEGGTRRRGSHFLVRGPLPRDRLRWKTGRWPRQRRRRVPLGEHRCVPRRRSPWHERVTCWGRRGAPWGSQPLLALVETRTNPVWRRWGRRGRGCPRRRSRWARHRGVRPVSEPPAHVIIVFTVEVDQLETHRQLGLSGVLGRGCRIAGGGGRAVGSRPAEDACSTGAESAPPWP